MESITALFLNIDTRRMARKLLDGIVKLWFSDVEAIKNAFQSPQGKATMEHAKTFIEEISIFIVEPRQIV